MTWNLPTRLPDPGNHGPVAPPGCGDNTCTCWPSFDTVHAWDINPGCPDHAHLITAEPIGEAA